MRTVCSLVERTALRYPNDRAISDTQVSLTYNELMAEVQHAKQGFIALGVDRCSRVGLIYENCADYIIVLLALWSIGACAVPLNTRLSAREISECISIAECDVVLFSSSYEHFIEAIMNTGAVQSIEFLRRETLSHASEGLGSDNPAAVGLPEPGEDDEVLNIFTGGTTGGFKAAVYTYRSLFFYVVSSLLVPHLYTKQDVYIGYAPLFHIGGLTEVLCMLAVGGEAVLLEQCRPTELFETLVEKHATQLLLIPPTIVTRFRDCMREKNIASLDDVRFVMLAGGNADPDVVARVFDVFPRAMVEVGYGMSELVCSMANVFDRKEFEANPDVANCIGSPLIFDEVQLVDDDGFEVPVGGVGEARGRSLAMFSGYRTSETIGSRSYDVPFDEQGWFATGDMMRCDERGMYHFMSRKKDMIKSGGENVYASEIEQVIRSMPTDLVKECAVVGVPDKELGEIVVAALVIRDGAQTTEREVKDYCRERLAHYKCPMRVFVLEELPCTQIGKVQKNRLSELLASMIDGE